MMKTTKTIKVPTGEIYIATGEKGLPLLVLVIMVNQQILKLIS